MFQLNVSIQLCEKSHSTLRIRNFFRCDFKPLEITNFSLFFAFSKLRCVRLTDYCRRAFSTCDGWDLIVTEILTLIFMYEG
jgi:hypothetical protein